jgi:hypothetical protein
MLPASFVASSLLAFASVVTAQGSLSCTAFQPQDPVCGFLSPATSVFTPGQALSLNTSYAGLLIAACPDVGRYASSLPLVFCLGAMVCIVYTELSSSLFMDGWYW